MRRVFRITREEMCIRDRFKDLDPAMWKEVGHNPVLLLERMSYAKLEALANDKVILKRMNDVYAMFRTYMDVKPDQKRPSVAYFSMEYGLNQVLRDAAPAKTFLRRPGRCCPAPGRSRHLR